MQSLIKLEYLIFHIAPRDNLQAILDKSGKDGWQLTIFRPDLMIFVRPLIPFYPGTQETPPGNGNGTKGKKDDKPSDKKKQPSKPKNE